MPSVSCKTHPHHQQWRREHEHPLNVGLAENFHPEKQNFKLKTPFCENLRPKIILGRTDLHDSTETNTQWLVSVSILSTNLSNCCRITRASPTCSLIKSTTRKAAQFEGTRIWPHWVTTGDPVVLKNSTCNLTLNWHGSTVAIMTVIMINNYEQQFNTNSELNLQQKCHTVGL